MIPRDEASLDGTRFPSPPEPALADREEAVLRELARETEARVAFGGLRRKLDLHQQALARTLRRLERDGLVAHDDKGYRLTDQGYAALRGRSALPAPRQSLPLVQALLPPHLDAETIGEHLSRRWFRGLRWYGQSEGPGESTLTWLAEPDNAAVRVRIASGALTLEAEVSRTNPGKSFLPARGVLEALAELYGVVPDSGDSPAVALMARSGAAA